MNKKRIGALLIAGTLAVGSGVYGAYSYFTASAQTETSISITVGNLKVQSQNDAKWDYVPDQTNDQIDLNDTATAKVSPDCVKDAGDLDVSNIRPGDAFEKTVTVKNTGSLTQDLKITKSKIKDVSPFVVTLSGQTFDKDGTVVIKDVKPGNTVTLKIRVELPGATENDKVLLHTWLGDLKEVYNTEKPNTFKLNLDQKFFDISATQPNAK